MKKELFFTPKILPWFTLITGGLGCLLRFYLMRTQVGAGGLLTANHPASILLYILTACSMAVLVMCVLPLKSDPRRFRSFFRKTIVCAFGCMFAAVGILFTCLQQVLAQSDFLNLLSMLMAFVAAGCFGLLAYARQKGLTAHYLAHAGIIVFLMLHLINLYRTWSPEPQLQLYIFQLLASVSMLLALYQSLCMDLRKGDRRLYVFFNQAALFFCFLCLPDKQVYFYLGMGLFAATNLCSLRISHSYLKSKSSSGHSDHDHSDHDHSDHGHSDHDHSDHGHSDHDHSTKSTEPTGEA